MVESVGMAVVDALEGLAVTGRYDGGYVGGGDKGEVLLQLGDGGGGRVREACCAVEFAVGGGSVLVELT